MIIFYIDVCCLFICLGMFCSKWKKKYPRIELNSLGLSNSNNQRRGCSFRPFYSIQKWVGKSRNEWYSIPVGSFVFFHQIVLKYKRQNEGSKKWVVKTRNKWYSIPVGSFVFFHQIVLKYKRQMVALYIWRVFLYFSSFSFLILNTIWGAPARTIYHC